MKNYMLAQLDEIEPVKCPCGMTKRAFIGPGNSTATMHMVSISADSRVHYHKKLTEVYLILNGNGYMELDGDRVAVQPMTSILIKPGCRHRAVGKLSVIVTAVPAFDVTDEWFDD